MKGVMRFHHHVSQTLLSIAPQPLWLPVVTGGTSLKNNSSSNNAIVINLIPNMIIVTTVSHCLHRFVPVSVISPVFFFIERFRSRVSQIVRIPSWIRLRMHLIRTWIAVDVVGEHRSTWCTHNWVPIYSVLWWHHLLVLKHWVSHGT